MKISQGKKLSFFVIDDKRDEFPEHMARFTSLAYTYNNMILAVGVESGGGVVKEVKGKENYEKVKKL